MYGTFFIIFRYFKCRYSSFQQNLKSGSVLYISYDKIAILIFNTKGERINKDQQNVFDSIYIRECTYKVALIILVWIGKIALKATNMQKWAKQHVVEMWNKSVSNYNLECLKINQKKNHEPRTKKLTPSYHPPL